MLKLSFAQLDVSVLAAILDLEYGAWDIISTITYLVFIKLLLDYTGL